MENKMKKEFATKVSAVITEMTGWKCEVREVKKNNDLKRIGIIIHKDSSNIAPTVYINDNLPEDAFNDICIREVREVAERFIEIVDECNAPTSVDDLQKVFSDKTEILNRVFFSLVSRRWNTDSEIVSRPVDGDLQYVYRIAFYPPTGEEIGTILLKKQHLELSGITENELYDAAKKNTPIMQPYSILSFGKVIEKITGTPAEQFPLDGFYVVSNDKNYFGATAITYPEVVEKLKAMLGDDIIIIPASIHETIVFSPQDNNDDGINNIIREVNETTVDPSERLSDHIYTYDASGNLVSAEDIQAQAS